MCNHCPYAWHNYVCFLKETYNSVRTTLSPTIAFGWCNLVRKMRSLGSQVFINELTKLQLTTTQILTEIKGGKLLKLYFTFSAPTLPLANFESIRKVRKSKSKFSYTQQQIIINSFRSHTYIYYISFPNWNFLLVFAF